VTIREAIVLAGGKAERLGEAAGGRPKSLVRVGESPLLAYQVALLVRAGVDRVIVSCASGQGPLFEEDLAGLGAEIVPVEEPEPLGRGGGLRYASSARRDEGDVYALNGDELVDLDLRALAEQHALSDAAATITVVPLESHLGIVDLDDDDTVLGFREKPRLPHWVSCGVYVLGEEALARLPERGDHESTTFPALAAERLLRAFRHEGIWLTVNTPKDLRTAAEHVAANPDWLEAS
jgi:NDP-sugar pyrophosphorylase family protein